MLLKNIRNWSATGQKVCHPRSQGVKKVTIIIFFNSFLTGFYSQLVPVQLKFYSFRAFHCAFFLISKMAFFIFKKLFVRKVMYRSNSRKYFFSGFFKSGVCSSHAFWALNLSRISELDRICV